MDFSDIPNYPMVANTDYSPTQDSFPFDKAYLADSYTTRPDYTFDTLFDADSFFDRPVNSVEYCKNQQYFNDTLPTTTNSNNTNAWSPVDSSPFGRFGDLNSAFDPTANPAFATINPASFDPEQTRSRTPSLCGDGAHPTNATSPSLSPRSLKRESSSDLDISPSPKRHPAPLITQSQPPRKRGRPRLDRLSTTSSSIASNTPTHTYSSASISSSSTCKIRPTQRLPHNQVERKYREGLNSELERLRRAVPTLIQRDTRDLASPPKPSKATILASAIEYIKATERERDALREEVERLRGGNTGRRARME